MNAGQAWYSDVHYGKNPNPEEMEFKKMHTIYKTFQLTNILSLDNKLNYLPD